MMMMMMMMMMMTTMMMRRFTEQDLRVEVWLQGKSSRDFHRFDLVILWETEGGAQLRDNRLRVLEQGGGFVCDIWKQKQGHVETEQCARQGV